MDSNKHLWLNMKHIHKTYTYFLSHYIFSENKLIKLFINYKHLMGCNNSRKNLQEKTSLNSKELEKCNEKFKKLSSVPPGYYYKIIIRKVE